MIPWVWTAVAASVGLLIGMHIQRRLATLSYRRDGEEGLPLPNSRWWVPVAPALGTTLLVFRYGDEGSWPWLLPTTLPIAILGPWLATIDLDVKRPPPTNCSCRSALPSPSESPSQPSSPTMPSSLCAGWACSRCSGPKH